MPHLTSPMSSPSLRTITHAQFRSSYFPAPPITNPPHAYHPRVPPTPQSSLNVVHHSPQPNLGSDLVGCLKHTQHISSRPPPPTHNSYTYAHPQHLGQGQPPAYGSHLSDHSSMMGMTGQAAGPYHTGEYSTYRSPAQPQAHAHGNEPAHSAMKPAMKSLNPQEKRRASIGNMRVSNIPLGPGSSSATPTSRSIHTSAISQVSGAPSSSAYGHVTASAVLDSQHGKRRPSFKIELPPRPNAYHTSASANANTVYSSIHQILPPTTLAHPLAQAQLAESPMTQPTQLIYRTSTPPVFRDPFPATAPSQHAEGGYMILRAPTRQPAFTQGSSLQYDPPSPTQLNTAWGNQVQSEARVQGTGHSQPQQYHRAQGLGMGLGMEPSSSGSGIVCLGYSLNRLRAPTPWLRGKRDGLEIEEEEDDEWLRAEDLDTSTGMGVEMRDLDSGMRGMRVD